VKRVVVIDTRTANLASVTAGLKRAGAEPVIEADTDTILTAPLLVLPGVGSFGAGMERLRELGLVEPLLERVTEGRPLLAVCLGLQLLFEASEESEGRGIGALPGTIRRFRKPRIVPQLGWNRVVPEPDSKLIEEGYAYYANSYRADAIPEGWTGAMSHHDEPFVAALERGPILACQFHPELSSHWGQRLMERWLAAANESLGRKEAD
jgi:imidazole glycerol phosphate synthase glutamine amidotransferase subunit